MRSGQDRSLADASVHLLLAEAAQAPVLHTFEVHVSKRRASCGKDQKRREQREARTAQCTLRAVRVTLQAPWRKGLKLRDQAVNAVLVRA